MDKILKLALSYPLDSYILALKGVLNETKPALKRRNVLILALITGISLTFLPVFHLVKKAQADMDSAMETERIMADLAANLPILQDNSLASVSSPTNPDAGVARRLNVVVTGYSSTIWQTDDTPSITASGKTVGQGVVANNLLPFGTEIRMPELYGDQVFVVEDRMSSIKGNYHVDIWFSSYWDALNFGAKMTYIEVLEN